MQQTTSRLRKAFHYPTDNDSDDTLPEVIDEEEQENLIRTLQQETTTRNAQYTTILLATSVLSVLPYLPSLFQPQTTLLSLFSITSLLSTSYMLYIFPPGATGIPVLDSLSAPAPSGSTPSTASKHLLRVQAEQGPIAQYLPYLNLGLCVLLVLVGWLARGEEILWWGFAELPAGLYTAVLVAKVVMGGVDPEAELRGLKYEFKGA